MRTKEENTIYMQEYRKNNREKMREYKNTYNAKFDKEKNRVRAFSRRMINKGFIKVKNKCERCKIELNNFNKNYHHEDYNKPLEITFFCKTCHYGRHKLKDLSLEQFIKTKNNIIK